MGDTRRQQSYLSRNILNSELNHPHIQEDSLFQRILNSIPKYNFKNRQKGTIFIVVKQLDKHNEFVSRHVSDFGNHFRVKLKKKMKRVDSFEAHESIVTFDGPMVFQISYNAESFQQKYATVTIELCQSEASRSLNSKTFRINILTMINEYKQNFQSTINMQSIPNNWIKYQIPMNYAGILEIEFAFQEFFNQNQVARLQRLMDEQVSSSVTPRQNVFQSTGMTLYSSSQPMPLSPASSVTPLSAKVSSVPLSSEVMNEPLSSLPENEKINGKKSTTQVKNVRSKVSAIYPQDFKDSKEVEQSHDVPTPRFEIKSRHMWKFRSICFQCRHNFTCCKWRHHCRHCGESVCHSDSNHFIDLRSDAKDYLDVDSADSTYLRLCSRCNIDWIQFVYTRRSTRTNATPPSNQTTQPPMESSEPELPKPPPPDETSFQKKYNSTKLQKQASDRLMKREPVDIFFSLRFHDHGPMNEAKQLQQLLKEYQINACIVDAENAEDVELLVSSSIAQSKLVVIFGTRDYGTKTTINYSTHNELTFVINERKPFFLIKMCGEFDDSTTRFRLPSSIKYDEWNIGQPVPDGLLEKIIQKFIACNSM